MQTSIINIRIDKRIKQEVQAVAHGLGLPLGTIINNYLNELIREKQVLFSIPPVPNDKLQKLLKQIKSKSKNKKSIQKSLDYNQAIAHLDKLCK